MKYLNKILQQQLKGPKYNQEEFEDCLCSKSDIPCDKCQDENNDCIPCTREIRAAKGKEKEWNGDVTIVYPIMNDYLLDKFKESDITHHCSACLNFFNVKDLLFQHSDYGIVYHECHPCRKIVDECERECGHERDVLIDNSYNTTHCYICRVEGQFQKDKLIKISE